MANYSDPFRFDFPLFDFWLDELLNTNVEKWSLKKYRVHFASLLLCGRHFISEHKSTVVTKSLRPPNICFLTKTNKNHHSIKIKRGTQFNESNLLKENLYLYFFFINFSINQYFVLPSFALITASIQRGMLSMIIFCWNSNPFSVNKSLGILETLFFI